MFVILYSKKDGGSKFEKYFQRFHVVDNVKTVKLCCLSDNAKIFTTSKEADLVKRTLPVLDEFGAPVTMKMRRDVRCMLYGEGEVLID